MENVRQPRPISPRKRRLRRIEQIMSMLSNKRNSSTGDHFRVALVPPTVRSRKKEEEQNGKERSGGY